MAKRAESISLRSDFSLLIGGSLESSSEHLDVINPALGEVFAAPFLMWLVTRPSGREPDVLFVATDHFDRVKPTYIDGRFNMLNRLIC